MARRKTITNAEVVEVLARTASAIRDVSEAVERQASAHRHDQARFSEALEAAAKSVKASADAVNVCAEALGDLAALRPGRSGFGGT